MANEEVTRGEARQAAFRVLQKHPDCLNNDVSLNDLIEDIAALAVAQARPPDNGWLRDHEDYTAIQEVASFALRSATDISPTKGAALSLQKRPVAFRAKDALDQWILFDNEDEAASYAADTGFEYQGLYARDDKSPAPSASGRGIWEIRRAIFNEIVGRDLRVIATAHDAADRIMLALGPMLAPAPSPDNGDWLPIESAPKDGTRYLFAARYPDEWRYAVARWKDCRWFSGSVEGRITYLTSKTTHWRPLPPPPAQGGGKCALQTGNRSKPRQEMVAKFM